ncbi:hypothetical protein EC957_011619 [Mortierella hygrophila]|uniref:Uncharacterized protein n=1 Tax=Mortierella hygrophila TaxID=979708 RepID=A0A9P6K3U3_9FUNG|nr:hypothetical protein EC957_011619 [Mortierella hygrophila]
MKFISALAAALSIFAATSLAAPASTNHNNGLVDSLASTGALPLGSTLGGAGGTIKGLSTRSNPQNIGKSMIPMTKRNNNLHINAILDAILESNTKIIVKALAKLKLDLCSDIHAKIKVLATGLLTTNLGIIIPKISAKVNAETNAAINTKVELDTQSLVKDKIRQHGLHAIHKHCPHADDRCLRKHAREIVECVERAVREDVLHLFVALKANLMAHVRAKVAIMVRDLGVNLLVEQIHVQGFVDAVAELDGHFDMCSHIIVKGLHVEVKPHAVSSIKFICRSR